MGRMSPEQEAVMQGNDAKAWHALLFSEAIEGMSFPQRLQFMQMIEAEFNSFDPFLVVRTLLGKRALWKNALFGRAFWSGRRDDPTRVDLLTDLITLRDLHHCQNADTLMILFDKKKETEVLAMVNTWDANEIDVAPKGNFFLGGGYPDDEVLRVWWD